MTLGKSFPFPGSQVFFIFIMKDMALKLFFLATKLLGKKKSCVQDRIAEGKSPGSEVSQSRFKIPELLFCNCVTMKGSFILFSYIFSSISDLLNGVNAGSTLSSGKAPKESPDMK